MTTTDSEETAKAIAQNRYSPGKGLTGEMLTELQRNGETPDLSDVSLLAASLPNKNLRW